MPFSVPLFLLQWAIGGLLFGWVTTRHGLVGLGYGWLLRVTYATLAFGAFATGILLNVETSIVVTSLVVAVSCLFALAVSVSRRKAGVPGQIALAEQRSARVAKMTGIDRKAQSKDESLPPFDARLDLIAPVVGLLGLLVASIFHASLLETARIFSGALFLGVVTDAMLLGHWYLVQPGLKRAPLNELVKWTGILWVPEVVFFVLPTGMISVFTGAIDDNYAGLLGWFWGACVVTTIGLVGFTMAALKEKQYAAVMAATGLLYLSILTAFGIDLVARALLL